ncbi:MAG: DUF2232 domain-containing protein [Synergistaceae bacterium]|nr:DUF2232 domain-containing protein [Synergistaceae bacterium]
MKRIIPCVVITLAMIVAGSFLPVFGFLGMMLCPLPLCILGNIEGHKRMSIAELLIEATLFLVFSPTMAVYFLVGCAPLSAMIYTLSREDIKRVKGYSGAESLLLASGASIAFKLVLILLYWFFTKRNILLPDMSQVEPVVRQLYGSQPELMASVLRVLKVIPYLVPSLLILYCSAEAYMNYSLCSKLMKKLAPQSENCPPELPEFKLWRFPVSVMAVSFLSLLAGYFLDIDAWFEGSVFVMNLQIVVNAFMFVEGLAVVFWIMDGFRMRRAGKIAVCVILGFPFFWPWLIVIGMCDIVLNLRERIKFGAK